LVQRGDDGRAQRAGAGAAAAQPRPFVPRPGALGAPFPSIPERLTGHLTATVERPVPLLDEPGGRRLLTLRTKTEYGSARVLGVARRRGAWLGVQASELPNGRLGWLRTDQAQLGHVPFALKIDLSSRRLTVRREGRELRRMTVTIGGAKSPTPTGRFSVTDRLLVKDPRSPYGCCVLALTGHQPRLPPGWPGGDRLAVHANRDPATLGQARSLGCLRADPGQTRWLVDEIPLGTPVFIRA
nr:L,D-transpeptidase [Actinomycetota bacterium]